MRSLVAFFLMLPLLFTGCGSSTNASTSSSGAMSGNWQMSLLPSNNPNARSQSGFLLQTGSTLTGSVMLIDSPCSGVGTVNGTVTSTAVSLVVDPVGTQINMTGTLASNPTSMMGNYTLLSTGCIGSQTSPQTGTWTATLVAPMKGTISNASFTSSRFTSDPNNPYTMGGQVTQGANTGQSNTSLSGNMTSTNYPCFANANLTGVISGTSVTLNIVDPTGVQLGQVSGTITTDGTTFSGSYKILPQSTRHCDVGDEGSVSFTL